MTSDDSEVARLREDVASLRQELAVLKRRLDTHGEVFAEGVHQLRDDLAQRGNQIESAFLDALHRWFADLRAQLDLIGDRLRAPDRGGRRERIN
jgi:hypothetical protein